MIEGGGSTNECFLLDVVGDFVGVVALFKSGLIYKKVWSLEELISSSQTVKSTNQIKKQDEGKNILETKN